MIVRFAALAVPAATIAVSEMAAAFIAVEMLRMTVM
jgi:hypothetical protein